MARRRLIWKVLPAYGTAIVVCTLAVAFYAGSSANNLFRQETFRSLKNITAALEGPTEQLLSHGEDEKLQALASSIGKETGQRITIVAADGTVVAESHADPKSMDNHRDRPEIAEALTGRLGQSTRQSDTLKKKIYYVARPLRDQDRIIGVVRVSIPQAQAQAAINQVVRRVIAGGLGIALLIGLVTAWVYRKHISIPLTELRRGASRFAEGDLREPVRVPDTEESGSLAEALNSMAIQLDEKIRTISEQATEREAVLASMTEGVLAVDQEQHVISMNNTAVQLLGAPGETAVGKAVSQIVRNAELLRVISRALSSDSPVQGEIVLHDDQATRTLAVNATVLQDADHRRIGAVVVLNNVTLLRHLENVRQQFVANVSHELKTPITAIKAAVETVIEHNSETQNDTRGNDPIARRFLVMIARQADRLNAIIEDLLTLARLEQGSEDKPIILEPMRLLPILKTAAETCQANADSRHMKIVIEAQPELSAKVNNSLLCQAVVNLLDNAIKYSIPEGAIGITAEANGQEVMVAVKDQGPGIEPEHLHRLFERFYRTDKARSRDLGGTGLGLAIVKHVAQVHGGRVTVDSQPGHGATFCIHLPKSA